MTTTATTNKKRIHVPRTMAKAGLAVLQARPDVEIAMHTPGSPAPEFRAALAEGPVAGVILSVTPFGAAEIAAAKGLRVASRGGVGYDAVDIPAMTKARIPVMITGTANSPSVAEQAMFMMMTLAKRGAQLDRMVRDNRWGDRYQDMPLDLIGKTLLVIGHGRIGSRTVKRGVAMEMRVLVHDPYVPAAGIRAAGAEPVADLDQAVAAADFISIHAPKTPATTNLFDAKRLARMKPTAYLVNTARGGIIDETALHAALTTGKLAGAGLDVLLEEPPPASHPLFKLPNVVFAPHMAGVTREAFDRMAIQAAQNVLDVLDGKPNPDNVVNKEVLG